MRIKKFLAGILSLSMLASATAALAAAPSAYDGQPYPASVESNDPDGEINLAVIANGKVDIVGDAMYIKGSVYSNDTIYVGDGEGNKVDGLFISGVKGMIDYTTGGDLPDQFRAGYIHVNDNHEMNVTNAYSTTLQYEGAIYDDNTSFECAYSDFTVPVIDNNIGDVTVDVNNDGGKWECDEANVSYYAPGPNGVKTITEDTYIETLSMNGTQAAPDSAPGLTIDTTNGDVTVVINNFTGLNGEGKPVNPTIRVVGDHEAYIYINNVEEINDFALNYNLVNASWQFDPQIAGSTEHTHLYITGGNVVLDMGRIAVADMKVNADTLEISGSTVFYGDIESNAETFTITGGQTEVYGIVCVPNADSEVIGAGTLYGQLHTDTLTINGAGRIIWQADSAVAKGEDKDPETPDSPKLHLNIIEDVVYIVLGEETMANFTLDKNTNYKWTISDNSKVWYSTNSLNENIWNPGYLTANDVTFDSAPASWGSIQPGTEIIVTATSVDDESIYDTAKIIFVASKDDIPGGNEPTPTPFVPSGDEIDLTGLGYAYIFGYEPETQYIKQTDEEGNETVVEYTPIYMAPNDNVTREQVAAMIMRMIDQINDSKSAKYTLTPNIEAWKGQWFERGYAYLAGKGTFDGIDYVGMGPVTRGEVAKLVAYGLNLSVSEETPFADIADSEYKQYIEIMYAYGYMSGTSDYGFEPNRVMTRAEFCKMFNNIIGREDMGLTTADGHVVTADDYSIVDINGHWAYETILKATSAYDDDGNVDFQIRQDNIRNKLDNYNSQLKY